MRNTFTHRLLIAVYCISAGLMVHAQAGAPKTAVAKIDASTVWQIPPQFLAAAHAVCDAELSQVAECMIGQMQKAGAPASSIAFSRALFKQSHGEFGVLTGFQNESPVSFAWVTYPLRANTNYGLLLVNGTPAIVNVEDLKLLDRKTMEQSSQFHDTRNQFPKVDVWPGDRDGKEWPKLATRTEWRKAVCGGLSGTERMPRLCPRRTGDLHLEFRRQGQVLGHDISGHDTTAAVANHPKRKFSDRPLSDERYSLAAIPSAIPWEDRS
jgi:hypothetical protein